MLRVFEVVSKFKVQLRWEFRQVQLIVARTFNQYFDNFNSSQPSLVNLGPSPLAAELPQEKKSIFDNFVWFAAPKSKVFVFF
jgi:hypothetical protein